MAKTTWPALKSCKSCTTSGGKWNDGLSQLPDDVMLSIMSHLTMKEAARTSTLSHRWKKLWAFYPGILNFEDLRTEEERRSRSDEALVSQDTSNFVSWVTRVVEQHIGPAVDEFRVAFDLDDSHQSHIDKWVVFALAKGVKSLVLDFNVTPSILLHTYYTLPLKCCIPLEPSHSLASSKPGLRTLVLKSINITSEALQCLLCSCTFLENLRIHRSMGLASIRAPGSPLALEHLHVSACPGLANIEILAPKLLTFRYTGQRIQLHIENASLLSEVSIGGVRFDPIDDAFDSLAKYFSQLEYLDVTTSIYSELVQNLQMNLVIHPISNLTNLKHLMLNIYATPDQTLLGWINLIEACPVLQKLTLKLQTFNWTLESVRTLGKRTNARPLECLKTLELYGFVGSCVDLEFATHVLENAVGLEQVIVDFNWCGYFGCVLNPFLRSSMVSAMELTEKLPPGAKLILNECRTS